MFDCENLGDELDLVPCPSCTSGVQVKVYECAAYGQCTLARHINGMACCLGTPGPDGTVAPCAEKRERVEYFKYPEKREGIVWSYGVMTAYRTYTVDRRTRQEVWTAGGDRLQTLLPATLRSLSAAGFGLPRLFIDGCTHEEAERYYHQFGLHTTTRFPSVKVVANWILSMQELYLRDPLADRYALFQDDFVTSLNLRAYLEACPYPDKGYLNLYTFPSNQRTVFKDGHIGWREAMLYESPGTHQFYHGKQQQAGRGAVALVFDQAAIKVLLTAEHLHRKPKDPNTGRRKVDGGIVEAMNQAGWREYVHNPSLVQHRGKKSAMGNKPHPTASSFRGEGYDLTNLLISSREQMVGKTV